MNPLDVRTVMTSYIVSNAVCVIVLLLMWRQNRRRFAGLGLWLADYLMQFAAVLLIALRGTVSEGVSVMFGGVLAVGGTVLLLIGLERFTGKPGPQWQNLLILAAFLIAQAHFYFITPSLTARNITYSLALLAVCFQCAWLLLRRTDVRMRADTRIAGWILGAYAAVSLFRIFADLAVPSGNDFFRSNVYDTAVLMAYQMLFIGLTFSLFLMVNRRLVGTLDDDIAARKRMEEALRVSEEKFSKAFHSSPDAVLISRARDGRLLEVNDGFCRLTGYSREEALAGTSADLSLWADPKDREQCVAALRRDGRLHNGEYRFRTKSGEILCCLFSGEIINLAGEAHIVSVVRDISGRKQAEAVLRRSEADFREVFDHSAQGIFIIDVSAAGEFRIRDSNPAQESLLGSGRGAVRGLTFDEVLPPGPAQALRAACLSCLSTGEPVTLEEAIHTSPDGAFVHTTLAPVRDDAGRIHRIIGSSLDITERKRMEDIIRLRLSLWEYAATHSVDELMRKALDEIEGITGSLVSFYHFVKPDQTTLELQAWSTRTLHEFCSAEGKGLHYGLDRAGVWADSIRLRKPVIHNDYAALPGRKGMPPSHAEIRRELVVPTLRGGRVVSVLGVGNKPSPYDAQDAGLLSYIADIIWAIVDRKRSEEEIQHLQGRLREMAVRDPLTGLYNRYFMDETLRRELARAAREKYPVSFVMIDIDHFKKVNDTFGHTAGDAVLKDLATLLVKNSRASDIHYRYGGEEFLVVLPKVKAGTALQIAEKWRKGFQESTMLLEHGGVKATISCGIAVFPEHGSSAEDIVAGSDQALYQAKSTGRNRSVIFTTAPRRPAKNPRPPRGTKPPPGRK